MSASLLSVSQESILAIDLGGTYTRLAVYGPKIRGFQRIPTPPGQQARAILSGQIRRLLGDAIPRGIGVSRAPGIDPHGRVTAWPSRPDWLNVPLLSILESTGHQIPVSADDGACAAMWESLRSGNTSQTVACLSIGTGLGVGIAQGGQIRDCGDGASTISHRVYTPLGLQCKCGKSDCIQILFSAEGLAFAQASGMMPVLAAGVRNLCDFLQQEYLVDHIVLTGGGISRFGAPFFQNLIMQAEVDPSLVTISETPGLSALGGVMTITPGSHSYLDPSFISNISQFLTETCVIKTEDKI